MRPVLVLAATILLAACGDRSGGDDFSFDVAMAPGRAQAELAQLDGGVLLQALRLPLITASQSADGVVFFTLPGDPKRGTLRLRFEEIGTNGSRVHVALDLPAVSNTIDGERMVLVEGLAEGSLKADLEDWANAIDSRGYASLEELNSTLGAMSIALQPGKLNELRAAATDPETLAGLIDPAFMTGAEGGNGDGYDEAAERESGGMGDPMVDPEAGLAAASAPMDDAEGVDPSSDWSSEDY